MSKTTILAGQRMTSALLETVAVSLDRARGAVLRLAVRSAALRRLVAERDVRLTFLSVAQAILAAGLAVICPVFLYVVGPVALGVVHVAADVRYLVLRRRLPGSFGIVVASFCLALLAIRVVGELGRHSLATSRLEFALAGAFALTAAAFGARDATARGTGISGAFRLAAASALVALALWLALVDPGRARLALTIGHNFVALLLWSTLFRRAQRPLAIPLGLTVTVAALLSSGLLYGWTLHGPFPKAFGLHVLAVSDFLAPGLRADRGIGLVQSFVFMQSVHYAVWLLFIPQEDEAGQGLTTFRRGARALEADFGNAGLALVGAGILGVIGFACVDAVRASRVYLSLALFHGYLEIAVFAFFFCRGRSTAAEASAEGATDAF